MLVVSKVCAGGYGAGRVREERTSGEERLGGLSAAGTDTKSIGIIGFLLGGGGEWPG